MNRDRNIEGRAPGLFVPDVLVSSQYFDRIRSGADKRGEWRLMVAVLTEAVEDYLKHVRATAPHHQQLFREAEEWIETQDRGYLFSFASICEHLGIDAEYVRRGLRAKRPVEAEPAAPVAVPDDEEPLQRRASNS